MLVVLVIADVVALPDKDLVQDLPVHSALDNSADSLDSQVVVHNGSGGLPVVADFQLAPVLLVLVLDIDMAYAVHCLMNFEGCHLIPVFPAAPVEVADPVDYNYLSYMYPSLFTIIDDNAIIIPFHPHNGTVRDTKMFFPRVHVVHTYTLFIQTNKGTGSCVSAHSFSEM